MHIEYCIASYNIASSDDRETGADCWNWKLVVVSDNVVDVVVVGVVIVASSAIALPTMAPRRDCVSTNN